MKLNFTTLQNNQNFSGIRPPYLKNGYLIKPIALDPTKGDIDSALYAAQTQNPIGRGLNGTVYPYSYLGRDLVVKKYFPKEQCANQASADNEYNKLDMLYSAGVKNKDIQQGLFSLVTPEDNEYLVSLRVNGLKPNIFNNRFNNKNLSKMVQLLGNLDLPRRNCAMSNLPYYGLLHYDLALGNLLLDENNAGLIDFEYMKKENLNRFFEEDKRMTSTADCNLGDVCGLPSNLRGFEYRTFLPYLIKTDKQEAKKLFDDYLKFKSNYHLQRFNFFKDEKTKTDSPALNRLAKKELAHSEVLSKLNNDTRKAEAYKMQIARFIYVQSPFEQNVCEVNSRQINKYLDEALEFFEQRYDKFDEISRNDKNNVFASEQKEYYKDGFELVLRWQELHNWMNWQKKMPKKSNFCNLQDYINALKNHELFMAKLTDKNTITLDKYLGL